MALKSNLSYTLNFFLFGLFITGLLIPNFLLAQTYGSNSYGGNQYGNGTEDTSGISSSGGSSSGGRETTTVEASSTITMPADIKTMSREAILVLIAELKAEIARRLALNNTGSSGFTFKVDLTIGSEGEDVKKLQQFLNSKGFIIKASGPGSPGNESTYFGDLTREALAQFQAKNAIVPAVGFFGPVTRTLINSLLGQ